MSYGRPGASGRLLSIAWRETARGPMREVESATISVERGVGSDTRGKPSPRQVTLLAAEGWAAACAELGEPLPWTLRRANLLVEGVGLEGRVGARVRIGGALVEITEETDPCRVMDLQHEGLRTVLEPDWRGGACGRVIENGTVEIGDAVTFEADAD